MVLAVSVGAAGAQTVPNFTTPTSLSFGSQLVGTSSVKTFKITAGTTGLQFGLSVTGDYAATSGCVGNTIGPGGICIISVTFTPTAYGSRPGTVVVTDVTNSANQRVVKTSGTGVAETTVLPATLAFGNVVQFSVVTKTFKLTNYQLVPLTNIVLTSSHSDYTVTGCPATLAAKGSCTATVTFTPRAPPAAAENASIRVWHSAITSPQDVTLTGTSVFPLTLSTGAITFATTVQGHTKTATLSLKNNLKVALPAGSVSLATQAPFSATGCTANLGAGSSCTITVTYAPGLADPLSVSKLLTVSSTNPKAWNRPTATLKGTALPQVSVTPTPLSFGSITVAAVSAGKTISIKNNRPAGSPALTLGNPLVTFAGASPGDFARTTTTCGATLGPGASCTATITFKPARGGERSALANVNSSALGSPHRTTLTGTGINPMTVTPNAVDFGSVNVGLESAAKVVTLKNNQDIDVVFTAVTVTGEFVAKSTTCGTSLAAGASCTHTLAMRPQVAATRTGTFVIASNTTASPNVVPLSGKGLKGVSAAVTSLAFGGQKVGTSSIPKQIILTNHQIVPATVGMTITGDYTGINTCGGTIAPQSSCTAAIVFTPTAIGARNGTASFNNPGSTSPLNVSLTGTGNTTDPPAAVRNVSPGAGKAGTTVVGVIVTGNGFTHFAANSVVNVGSGVTAANVRNVSPNSLTVDLTIAAGTSSGGRTVTVTTPLAGGGTETASLASGFVVSVSPNPSFIAIAPQVGVQGQTFDIAIVGQNTNFSSATTATFGDGVFVNALSIQDATHAVASVTIGPTAALGWRAVTVVTGGEFATLTPTGGAGPGLLVTESDARLSSISRISAALNETFVVTVIGLQTHFLQGATEVSFGAGISVGNTTVISPTQLTASLTVQAGAAPGLRSVIATTGGEVARLEDAFRVTPSTAIPYLSSVTPATGQQGETLTLSIGGVNTQFTTATPAPSLSLGSNIAVQALSIVDNTHLTAIIAIDQIAATGARSATLTSGGSSFPFSFAVDASPAAITAISPPTAGQGSQLRGTVTGVDTHWAQSATIAYFLPAGGCALPVVSQTTVLSPTAAELLLTIPANSCTGQLTVQLATGGEAVNTTFGVYRTAPSLALSPSSALAGTSLTVNFTGEFTHFKGGVTGPTTASIDGAGVTIQNFAVTGPTSATATFVIAPGALTGGCAPLQLSGCHAVTLTTPLGTSSEILTAPFHVTSTPAALVEMTPSHALPGSTTLVRIFGSFTHFTKSVTSLGFGPDVTVDALTIISATELTANVTVGNNAALGYRSAFVNTVDEQLSIAFHVDSPGSPRLTSVTPSKGQQGQSLSVTITGLGTRFNANSQLILGAGVTVADFTVQSATSATAIVDISPTAPVGPNTVVVISPVDGGEEIVTGSGFSLARGAQQLLFVKGATAADPTPPFPALGVTQSQVINVALVGQGTHWLQGASVADFGPGVVVNQLTVQDPTHATAQITALSTAALGFHAVGVATGSEYVAVSQGLNVQQGTPLLLASNPGAGAQGTTFNVQVLGSLTHWQQGVTTASFGDGVVVNSFTVLDSLSGVANVTIDSLAYPDAGQPFCRPLIVTTGIEQVSLPSRLCVVSGVAQITSVTPSASGQGLTPTVTVTGQGTHFVQGLTIADFGDGISPGVVTVTSPTSASVPLGVASNAAPGFRTASLRTLGESASMSYAFVVGQNTPTLNAATPTTAQQGQQNLTVRLTGQNTHWAAGATTVTFGQGITLHGVVVVNDTTLDALISVGALANVGGRTITVTTGGEIVSASLFSVSQGAGLLTGVSPSSGNQGQELVLAITGSGTTWSQGVTQFSIAGGGSDIKVNYVLINNATSATAGITIAPNAALGGRSVYMTTGTQVLVNQNALIVTGGVPSIASLSPGTAQPGQTNVNVQIQGLHTKWLTGTTTADFGPGISVTTLTVNNDTALTAVVAVASSATLGSRKVAIRNVTQAGTQVLEGNFQVVSSTPPSPSISYMLPLSGLRGQTFSITFSGQHTHWNPATSTLAIGDPGTSGITINSFQVTSPTSAIANITIGPNAAFASNVVEIETGAELVQAAFTVVQAVPTLTLVDPAAGMQGATMFVNVLGQHTGFNESTTFSFGTGVSVESVEILGPTIARLQIAIDQLAVQGAHGVTAITNGVSVGGPLFVVTPSQAAIVGVTPNTARQNDSIDVDIVGTNTHWSPATAFSFGSGITVTNRTVVDATHATVRISIGALATLGIRSVIATTAGETASMSNAFIVQAGTPLVLSSGPGSGQQQQNVILTIIGQFTNWSQAQTTVAIGNGVNVTGKTVTGPASITANATIDWFAPLGPRTMTVTTGSQVLTLPSALLVTAGPAFVSQVTPGQAGQNVPVSVVVTGTNTHFAQNSTSANFGPDVTINSVQVTSLTSATINLTASCTAAPGPRTVTLTTQNEVATAQNAFTVQQTCPRIQFVTPSSRPQGTTSVVKVIGAATNFGATTVFNFGPGVTVNSKTIISSVEADVNITVSSLAALTTRNVTATTGGTTITGTNLFTVAAGPAYLSAVAPRTGRQNQNGLQVTISGNSTHFTAAPPAVNLGPGVTVANVQVTSATLLVATVNIAPTAPVQLNDVCVTVQGEVACYQGGFEVETGTSAITNVSPSSARQGETLNVVVTGLHTHFVQGQTTASFGAGIAVNGPVTVTNATQATVNITVQPGAATGARTVTMTTGTEVTTLAGAFSVLAGQPVLSALIPNVGLPNSTVAVSITGQFTHFVNGTTQATFGPGISVNGATAGAFGTITVSSPTSATAALTISAGAALGPRDVTVKTGTEQATLVAGFNVHSTTAVIGGFNTSRAGGFGLVDGGSLGSFRADLAAKIPYARLTSTDTLNDTFLGGVDVALLSSVTGNNSAVTALSASEQLALRNFVRGGGGAVILVDNDSFAGSPNSSTVNNSFLTQFGLHVTGTDCATAGTITDPPSSPVTSGPFGSVSQVSLTCAGWFDTVGPASSLGTLQSGQPFLAVLPANAMAAGSGAVVFISDTALADSFWTPANRTLIFNAIAFVAPEPLADFEIGDLTGWTLTGNAWTVGGTTNTSPNVQTISGLKFVRSGAPNVAAPNALAESNTGSATSPAYEVTARTLSWYAAGWSGSSYDSQSYFQILDGAMNVIGQTQTPQSDPWVRMIVDLTSLGLELGDTFHLRAVDGKNANNYSWLAFDKLTLRGSLAPEAQAPLLVVTGLATAEFGSVFVVSASGGSGTGAVTFSATGACSNAGGGSTVTMTASSGICTITATKAADPNYLVATASATVTATKATQPTLTVVAPANANPNTTFTASTAGGGGTGAVLFSVGGSCSNTNGGASITMTGSTGGCQIIASKAGDTNYFPASSSPALVIAGPSAPAAIDIVGATASLAVCKAGDPQCNTSTNTAIPGTLLVRLQANTIPVTAPTGGVPFVASSDNTQCVSTNNGAIAAGASSASSTITYGGTAALPCTATVTVSATNYGFDTVVVTVNRYSTAPLASAAGAISYYNPAPVSDPVGVLRTRTAAVSYYNPAPIPLPGGNVAAKVAAVSYYNPAPIPIPGGNVAAKVAAVSYYNPAPVPSPNGTTKTGPVSVSYFNPLSVQSQAQVQESVVAAAGEPSIQSTGTDSTTVSSTSSISVANGPTATQVEPVRLSRTLGQPYVLTIEGANLSGATTVTFVGLESDVAVDQPVVSDDGRSLTVNVYVLSSAPLGLTNLIVSGPGWSTPVVPAVRVEIVP
jgi:hypothetical protein